MASLIGGYFFYSIQPPHFSYSAREGVFEISPGDGFSEIARRLEDGGFIRHALAFKALSVLTDTATRLKPGRYHLASDLSSIQVLDTLVAGSVPEVEVRIPEGASVYRVDAILAEAGIIRAGSLIDYAASTRPSIEGRLFPDRYRFFEGSEVVSVVRRMYDRFLEKAAPLLPADANEAQRILTLASILEGEVPDYEERRIVAGVLEKRVAEGMPLQVDATICYLKQVRAQEYVKCLPITRLDLDAESPYNTYLNKGWPVGPIGSPGAEAIRAAQDPSPSPYWFYVSDPNTRKTVFARTLDEHRMNRVKYLE